MQKTIIIENQRQYEYVKDLLDYMSGTLHKQSREELLSRLGHFIVSHNLSDKQPIQLLRQLFQWGVIGVELKGGSGVTRKGGTHFNYYYENPSINPLSFKTFCIHLHWDIN